VVEKKSGSNGGEGSDASDGSDGVGDDVLEIPIRFSAEPAEPVVLPGVACSLTTPADVVIPVSNPTSEELVVEVDSDSVTPGVSFLPMQTVLAPHATGEVLMKFTPAKALEDNVVDPNDALTEVKNVLLTGTHGITWHYLLPVTIFADDESSGGEQEHVTPQVVPVVCGEEKLFEVEINNTNPEQKRSYVIEIEQSAHHPAGATGLTLLRKSNRVTVPPNSTKGVPVCLQTQYMCAHHAIVKARPINFDEDDQHIKEKSWHIVGLARPSKPCTAGVIKCVAGEKTTKTFTVQLVDASPHLDTSQLSVDVDCVPDAGVVDCRVVDHSAKGSAKTWIKCQCTVESHHVGRFDAVAHIYHPDGFFWEKPMAVRVAPAIVDTISIQSQDLLGVDCGIVSIPTRMLERGRYTVTMTPPSSCLWTDVSEGVVRDANQPLRVRVKFEPSKSTGTTEAQLVVAFESGKQVAFAVRGIKPGLQSTKRK